MTLVLDSSVTLAWVMGEEPIDKVGSLIEQVIAAGAIVPSLWRLEVANGLQTNVRRKRLSPAARDANVADLLRWPISIDDETDKHAWSATLRLADRHELTLYDASYLELALRRDLPLATLDRALIAAATAVGVPLRA